MAVILQVGSTLDGETKRGWRRWWGDRAFVYLMAFKASKTNASNRITAAITDA